MKKIKLFLVATEDDLTEDRMAISDLIGTLNDKYEDKELYFQLVKPKAAPTEEDMQDCEMAFILWFHHSDEITAQSFEKALSVFQKSGKPKIITYFKQSDGVDVADDVGGFMERLDKELGHYYNLYEHIDSLRFSLMMQISALESSVSLECKNGDVLLEGEKYLSLYDIPCAAGNKALSERKAALKKATAKFFELRELYADDEDNEELAQQYMDASERRRTLREQVAEMEKNILAAALSMAKNTSAGALSDRQKEAYRLFEKGDYEGANTILDFNEIKEDIKSAEAVAGMAANKLQTGVNELLQKISVLMAGVLRQLEYAEVESCYREAVRVEEAHNLPKTAMEQFFIWLQEHHQNAAAITLGEKLMLYKKLGNENITSLLLALADLYFLSQDLGTAENYCTQALTVCGDADARYKLAAYVTLSKIEYRRANYIHAKELIERAIEQFRTVAKLVSRETALQIMLPFSEQSIEVYTALDDYEMAAAVCDRQMEHLLSGVNMETDKMPVSVLEWHLKYARLHLEMGDSVDAERYLFIMQSHAGVIEEDPVKYGPILTEMYLLLVEVSESSSFFEAALYHAQKAREAIRPVYFASPVTHWALMAKCQLAYGKALFAMDCEANAKEAMKDAVQICEDNAQNLEFLDNRALVSEIDSVLGEALFYTDEDMQNGLHYFDRAGASAAEIADLWGSMQNIHRYCRILTQAADCLTSARVLYPAAKEHIDAAIGFYETDLTDYRSMTYLSYAKAHRVRGELLLNLGQPEQALGDFDRAAGIIEAYRPFSGVFLPREMYALFLAYEGKARADQDLGNSQTAYTDYQKAVDCFEDIEYLFSCIHPTLREHWKEETPWPYTVGGCPKTNGWHSAMRMQLGALSEALGDDEKAEECYEQAVGIALCNPLIKDSDGLYGKSQLYWERYVDAVNALTRYAMTHEASYLHDFDIPLVIVQGCLEQMECFLQKESKVLLAAQRARLYELKARLLTEKATASKNEELIPEILELWCAACDCWADAIEQKESVMGLCVAVTGLLNCRTETAVFCLSLAVSAPAAGAEAGKLLSANINTISRWESSFTEEALPLLFEDEAQQAIHLFYNQAALSLEQAADYYLENRDTGKAHSLYIRSLHFCSLIEHSEWNYPSIAKVKAAAAQMREMFEQKASACKGGGGRRWPWKK